MEKSNNQFFGRQWFENGKLIREPFKKLSFVDQLREDAAQRERIKKICEEHDSRPEIKARHKRLSNAFWQKMDVLKKQANNLI